jgi:hypothetical protein
MTTSIDLKPTNTGKLTEEAGSDERVGETVEATFTPEEERKVLRKIDMVVLPFVSGHPFLLC